MNNLVFEVEWEDPGGARGDELRATWARLSIFVAGDTVTRVEDSNAHSVREAVYGPLYPLAEWMAENWWALLYEAPSRYRAFFRGYWRRHSLAAASEGYALPDLQFIPEGEHLTMAWRPTAPANASVQFLASGVATLETREVEVVLRGFIEAVLARLDQAELARTPLAETWAAINAADSDERAFCEAIGRLGRDPYALPANGAADAIIAFANQSPSGLFDEFLYVAELDRFQQQSHQIADFLAQAKAAQVNLASLRALKAKVKTEIQNAPANPNQPAWEQGYAMARVLRSLLSAEEKTERITDREALGHALGAAPEDWNKAILKHDLGPSIDGGVAPACAGAPLFTVTSRAEASVVFKLCRALCEYLGGAEDAYAALITEAHSERQKRNRAFAAEFIAPADALRRVIGGAEALSEDDLQELASEFGASEYVIQRQVENHGIAVTRPLFFT